MSCNQKIFCNIIDIRDEELAVQCINYCADLVECNSNCGEDLSCIIECAAGQTDCIITCPCQADCPEDCDGCLTSFCQCKSGSDVPGLAECEANYLCYLHLLTGK